MTASSKLHLLLSRALATVTRRSDTTRDPRAVAVARLFEEVPLQLEQARQGGDNCDVILADLRDRAARLGLARWIEGQTKAFPIAVPTDECDLLYRLVHVALVEIRAVEQPLSGEEIFRLMHLFHRIPLRLASARHSAEGYDEILTQLHEQAERLGLSEWMAQNGVPSSPE